jgi:hypothetical protein
VAVSRACCEAGYVCVYAMCVCVGHVCAWGMFVRGCGCVGHVRAGHAGAPPASHVCASRPVVSSSTSASGEVVGVVASGDVASAGALSAPGD